jgi:hypothetical protein
LFSVLLASVLDGCLQSLCVLLFGETVVDGLLVGIATAVLHPFVADFMYKFHFQSLLTQVYFRYANQGVLCDIW